MEKKEILDNQKSDPRPVGRWIIYIDKCTGQKRDTVLNVKIVPVLAHSEQ